MIATVSVTDKFGGTLYKIVDPSIPITLRATWAPQRVPLMNPDAPPDPNNPVAWFPKFYFADGIQLLSQIGPTQFAALIASLERPYI